MRWLLEKCNIETWNLVTTSTLFEVRGKGEKDLRRHPVAKLSGMH